MKIESPYLPRVILCLILGAAGSAVAQGPDAELATALERDQVLDVIANTYGVAREGLSIQASEVQKLPLTGKTIRTTKATDASGEVYGIVTDGSVNLVDAEQALTAEEEAQAVNYGKLDARLAEKLAKLGPPSRQDITLRVSIWVKGGDAAPDRPRAGSLSAEAADAAAAMRIEQLRAQTAASRQSVVDALAKMGVQAQQAEFSPVVFARLTPAQIRAIEKHPDVVTIYGQDEYKLFSDKASTTQRVYNVWLAGNTGRNLSARVVVHEPDGVADTNPYLNTLTHPVSYWCPRVWTGTDCTLGKNFNASNQHASEVAGTIASTHALVRGMAPDVPMILSANSQEFNDAKLIRAAEWGIASGGAVTNMSWGTVCGGAQTVQSRWVDWATKNLGHTFVIAAGNHSENPADCGTLANNEKVSAPGLAWGAITVGSIADNGTGFWTGDAISGFSNWRNPDFATSMEKPEVVAVGQDVLTTDLSSDWLTDAPGVNGTSFAAPMVAGQVAQLIARQPGLIGWPEANKAAVLVSAFHDIETGRDRDGVGAVVMNVSDTAYRNGWVRTGNLTTSSANPFVYPNVIAATAGQLIRVALAWDSWSDGTASDVLGADFDLRVKRSDTGAVVCSSASVQNAWELCSFSAPVTGNYNVEVVRFSNVTGWPGTYFGVAWGVQTKPNFCSNAGALPATGGAVAVNTVNGSTYFDSYPAPAPTWNESGRERVYRLVLTATKDITATLSGMTADLDVFVLQTANCAADPLVPVAKGGANTSVFINDAPAGTYYIVVDGFNGAVGSASLSVSLTGP